MFVCRRRRTVQLGTAKRRHRASGSRRDPACTFTQLKHTSTQTRAYPPPAACDTCMSTSSLRMLDSNQPTCIIIRTINSHSGAKHARRQPGMHVRVCTHSCEVLRCFGHRVNTGRLLEHTQDHFTDSLGVPASIDWFRTCMFQLGMWLRIL